MMCSDLLLEIKLDLCVNLSNCTLPSSNFSSLPRMKIQRYVCYRKLSHAHAVVASLRPRTTPKWVAS